MTEIPSWIVPLPLPMPATLGVVKAYLIRGPEGFGLIDTGMNDLSSRAALQSCLAGLGVTMEQIGTVVCTHYHADHSGLGKSFMEAGAKLLMSESDAASLGIFLSQPEVDTQRATFFGRHQVPLEFESRVTGMFPFFRKLQENFTPSGVFQDGDKISLGGIDLEVLLTPGHTRGHACFLHREAKLIFTGDHIIPVEATHVSMREEVQGTDPLGGFIESLERVGALGALMGFPGHGDPIPDISVRADQLVRHHRDRIDQVKRVLDSTPRSAFDLSIKVFGDRKKVFAMWLAMSQALAYLEHLVSSGEAVEIVSDGSALYRIA